MGKLRPRGLAEPPPPHYLEADSRGELGHCTELSGAGHPRVSCCLHTPEGAVVQERAAALEEGRPNRPRPRNSSLCAHALGLISVASGGLLSLPPCAHPPGGKTEARAARGRPLLDGGRRARRGAVRGPGPAAAARPRSQARRRRGGSPGRPLPRRLPRSLHFGDNLTCFTLTFRNGRGAFGNAASRFIGGRANGYLAAAPPAILSGVNRS